MTTLAHPRAGQPRNVGILLGALIFLFPPLALLLIRPGYSKVSRYLGLAWLGLCAVFYAIGVVGRAREGAAPRMTARTPVVASAPVANTVAKELVPSPPLDSKQALERVASAEAEIRAADQHLKKYYGTRERVDALSKTALQMATLALRFKSEGKTDADKAVANKAESVGRQALASVRRMFASTMEEEFVKRGMDMKVVAAGAESKTLRVTYALMSKPLVYQFNNEMDIQTVAKKFGFTKVVLTNGFESDLGQTWTINL